MRAFIFVVLAALLPLGAHAQAYRAENRLIVVPLSDTKFEVIEARGEGARGLWCAAASFAQERLGQQNAARLYVFSARGPSVSGAGRKGVVFTVDEGELNVPASQSVSVSVRTPGQGLPTHHARQFCFDYLLELQERF